jgi:uncharacterized protein (DUF433 family)/DNA-binding transcriptional MerR regulator
LNYIGKGIYSLPEVHKITGISLNKIIRWTNGYTYENNDRKYVNLPVYKKEFDFVRTKNVLSFLDLIELLFINSFEKYGFSLQNIRKAAEIASKKLNTVHPFAKKCFFTDGKTILIRIAEEDGNFELLDLLKKQYQMEPLVSSILTESLEFDQYDLAEKWWPAGRQSKIVIDPKRNFGKPIIDDKNIRIDTIFDIYNRNGNIKEIMEWYELDEQTINEAVQFCTRKTA